MSRISNLRSVKPMLEELENRVQPSFLLQGAVQQLVTPLNTAIADMQSAITDVKVQHDALIALGLGGNIATAETAYGKGSADWHRALVDQHAIQATVNADLNFIRAATFAEFAEGDPTDVLILTFGPIIGFNPTSPLTNLVNQANSLINTDTTLQSDINTDFSPVSPLHTHNTFAQNATTPSF